ncbi:type II toxin-antitoxin system death-on-curing family toxin [Jannaschia sp. Os4]|uniref:type II toxin-antitoxin system death-on-curing family toxin n=1 Tax=Jannaschia sp. Os4 TaxID=2807617 RepID=UPI00193A4D98|nr:type II toxin-antitoxin system death-on-curing family toxin [Jannaschia sp. Os4]
MTGPRWIPLRAIVAIHDRQIARHGGTPGMRDQTLLEAGVARPMNRHAYGEADLPVLAAAYAFGIAKAHAFVDGNKRSAFVTAATFLRINGTERTFDQAEIVRMMEGLADGSVGEDAFADWLRGQGGAPQGR